MKRLAVASLIALAVAVFASDTARAGHPAGIGYPFYPFGFYQPYGARIGSSLPTPPYFSMNPPVYYGARYARPYGMSPFASPPVVTAPGGYEGRLQHQFQAPPTKLFPPRCNPYLCKSSESTNPYVDKSTVVAPVAKVGAVRENPFFQPPEPEKLAKN